MSRTPRVLPAGPRLAAKAEAERRDRRRTQLRRGGWGLSVLIPLLLVGWVVLGSSLLAVQKVVVKGESRLSATQIEDAARVSDGTPLARVDTAAIARRIRALGPIASVTVTRGWPHDLRITVVERRAAVAVPLASGFELLDAEGVALGPITAVPSGVLPLQVAHASATDPATRAALDVLRQLPAALRTQLSGVKAASTEQVTLLLSGGRQVIWGGVDDGAQKASALAALLKLPGTIYDVSAPGVVTRR